jgi:lysozyme
MAQTAVVLDLSHYDPAENYDAVKASGIVGIIYKGTQGTGYRDPTYTGQQAAAKAAGLLWGAYHFAEASDPEQQARNLLQYTYPDPDELFCLDWEDYGDNTMSVKQAKQWITIVERALNRPGECVIYSGNTVKELLGNTVDPFFGSRRLWLAQYGSMPVVQASWSTYWLWQYTDQGSCPGVNFAVDENCYDGPTSDLIAQWATGQAGGPTPVQQQVEVVISAPPGIKVNVRYV